MTKLWRYVGLALLALSLVQGGSYLNGQDHAGRRSRTCTFLRKRLKTLEEDGSRRSGRGNRRMWLRFLKSVPDDPEDCVTSEAQMQLLHTERTLMRLKIGGSLLSPDWLTLCGAIDPGTLRCSQPAPYADQVPLGDNGTTVTPHPLPAHGPEGEVYIDAGVACMVRGISVGSVKALQDGRPAERLSLHRGVFPLEIVSGTPAPVVIAAIECADGSGFRKASWRFR